MADAGIKPEVQSQVKDLPKATVLSRFVAFLESGFVPAHDLGTVSREHMVDLNAQATRNVWYDKRGNRWRLRDSI